VDLVAQPRHFDGRQWYFKYPITHTEHTGQPQLVLVSSGATRDHQLRARAWQVANDKAPGGAPGLSGDSLLERDALDPSKTQ
jgi:hypothetical protein